MSGTGSCFPTHSPLGREFSLSRCRSVRVCCNSSCSCSCSPCKIREINLHHPVCLPHPFPQSPPSRRHRPDRSASAAPERISQSRSARLSQALLRANQKLHIQHTASRHGIPSSSTSSTIPTRLHSCTLTHPYSHTAHPSTQQQHRSLATPPPAPTSTATILLDRHTCKQQHTYTPQSPPPR